MKALRTCEVCGGEFEARRSDVRICSNRCRQALYRRRHPRPNPEPDCWTCGKPYRLWVRNTQPGLNGRLLPIRSDAIYCSDACRQQAYRDRRDQEIALQAAAALAILRDR